MSVAIVSAFRTAIGKFNGTIASIPAHQLGARVFSRIAAHTGQSFDKLNEIIMGQVLVAGCGQNPARQASIAAGAPNELPAWVINQVCGSGLKAVALAYNDILLDNEAIVIAGGQESMSATPHLAYLRNGVKMGDAKLIDSMVYDGLTDIFGKVHMGVTAENIARQFNISREDQDKFAVASQNKAEKAQKSGRFDEEIIGIKIQRPKQDDLVFNQDEFIRLGATLEALSKLKPAFAPDGTVTAGNASGINDGAAAVMLMSLQKAEKLGLKPLAIIRSFAQAGVDTSIMGTGPVPASRKALAMAGWSVKDLELIEANEAFAAQAIYVDREMGWDTEIVNVNGGAIALGHPIGASGARILVTLLHEMNKRGCKKGLTTLCVGGGMGVAMCVERGI